MARDNFNYFILILKARLKIHNFYNFPVKTRKIVFRSEIEKTKITSKNSNFIMLKKWRYSLIFLKFTITVEKRAMSKSRYNGGSSLRNYNTNYVFLFKCVFLESLVIFFRNEKMSKLVSFKKIKFLSFTLAINLFN